MLLVPTLELNVEDEGVKGTGVMESISLDCELFSCLKLLRDFLRKSLRKAGAMVRMAGI